MKALRLLQWGRPAELCQTEIPSPQPGEVLIKIAGAGACHSDLHLMEWPEGRLPWKLPFTLGHENSGWIEELGAGVHGFRRGDSVLVYGPWGCGRCHSCRLGRENYCQRAPELGVAGGGLGLDGGMAEYMLVPSARFLVPLGDLDPIQAAPLADAALTPYHAIANARHKLQPGANAVVIGVGGLGQMAIQLLRLSTGAGVIAVDTDDRKLAIARGLGADVVVRVDAEIDSRAADAVRNATRGAGAELVLDMVGSQSTLALGAKALRTEGRLVIIGLAMGTLPVNFFALPYGAEVATSYWGTVPELMELVALAQRNHLQLKVSTYPLDEAPAVYTRLRQGEVDGRAVIIPGQ